MSLSTAEIAKLYPWITTKFVEKFLQKDHGKAIVKSIETESVTGKGENFCSNLIRITVEYSNPPNEDVLQKKFVLKADIPNEATAEFNNEFLYFVKEISVYADIMPLVQQLLECHSISGRFWPKCYGTDRKPDYLLFEDLRHSGFCIVNKSLGLDMDHMELMMTRVAQWHAATAVIHDKVSNLAVHLKC